MGTQLESFLTERNNKGRSILDMVAHYGDKTSFAAVLNAIRARLTHDQVRCFDIWLGMSIQSYSSANIPDVRPFAFFYHNIFSPSKHVPLGHNK